MLCALTATTSLSIRATGDKMKRQLNYSSATTNLHVLEATHQHATLALEATFVIPVLTLAVFSTLEVIATVALSV